MKAHDFLATVYAQMPQHPFPPDLEVERQITLLHRPQRYDASACLSCGTGEEGENYYGDRTFAFVPTSYPCPTMRLILAQYADVPGFDRSWLP